MLVDALPCVGDHDVENSLKSWVLGNTLQASVLGLLSGVEGLKKLRTVVSSLDDEVCWRHGGGSIRSERLTV